MSWVASSTDDQSEPSPGPKVVFPTPLRCRCREKLEGATTGAEALNDTGDPTVDDILDSVSSKLRSLASFSANFLCNISISCRRSSACLCFRSCFLDAPLLVSREPVPFSSLAPFFFEVRESRLACRRWLSRSVLRLRGGDGVPLRRVTSTTETLLLWGEFTASTSWERILCATSLSCSSSASVLVCRREVSWSL